jgi:surface polysaccharide O-acyltransferase-like enzyme
MAKKRHKVDYEAHTRTNVLKHESYLYKNVNIVTSICNIWIYRTTKFFLRQTFLESLQFSSDGSLLCFY